MQTYCAPLDISPRPPWEEVYKVSLSRPKSGGRGLSQRKFNPVSRPGAPPPAVTQTQTHCPDHDQRVTLCALYRSALYDKHRNSVRVELKTEKFIAYTVIAKSKDLICSICLNAYTVRFCLTGQPLNCAVELQLLHFLLRQHQAFWRCRSDASPRADRRGPTGADRPTGAGRRGAGRADRRGPTGADRRGPAFEVSTIPNSPRALGIVDYRSFDAMGGELT
ncbi:hypothetical protein EVAR_92699_1 [Eumeta japonica]|uniref:Uncharacterized protein n=1 Tax=Eumeta variegata TaxID=151549 RepID=A0A4C1SXT5_EUMVA|nr:hypothetical protein EVAR_92699_1 [Eumeta japonica]